MRTRRLRAPAGACAAGILLALAPSSATAAASTFWGVSSQTPVAAADLARMAEAEVGTLRALFSWAAIEPGPGGRDWSSSDALVAAAAANGIRVLPVLGGTPDWVARGPDRRRCVDDCGVHPPRSRAALRAWRRFVGDAVRRYGRGGEFWSLHPELAARPIVAWQIWNEQNSPDFFAPRISARRYARVLDRAAHAIRGADRRATVVLGGMAEFAGVRGARPAWRYLRALYRLQGARRDFDGVGVHPYAANVAGVRKQLSRTRRAMRRAGDRRARIWVTEIGVASGTGGDPFELGTLGQADHLRRSFRLLRDRRRRLGIRVVIWFSWRDSPTALCAWCPTSGLFDGAYAAKPAFEAFTRFTGGR
jgi:polysaccharide biosynthesis protein PslG